MTHIPSRRVRLIEPLRRDIHLLAALPAPPMP
jgi:hypothetical protein